MLSYRSLLVFSRFMLLSMFVLPGANLAAVNIDKTRIVFNAGDTAQSVNLINKAESPAIVQIWTDGGDIHLSPDKSKTPVMVVPPVLKMMPGEMRSLRLMLTSRTDLNADKENLYWLNIYQIPALTRTSGNAARKVVLPLRLRLKVFVRPAGLSAPQTKDAQKLRFIQHDRALRIMNPAPWFTSMNAEVANEVLKDIMIAPFSSITIPVKAGLHAGDNIHYEVIDDQGNASRYQSSIEPQTASG
ncbi:fimbrial assembly protein [Pantoea ananatis]|uniref:fimbrial assembly chaperone n=1 Tax=Pantoea ananas TaxID=553 RepID=UPI0007369319|nr:fimbrial assembly chaperone [Pantoea ananatis]KTR46654.1 fimbrial assembly protein [Pantoea ananatis]KTR54743.1 fimbrial assembly protein [Pantoea ananatis]KTR66811.1 fimbrial assembly protein [Pantoea ananatis]KTR68957.1 fimbrial assembly protein [Pantoea ananatis]MDC7860155.1 fimbrial assembly protein [Pantoea ananatis]